jgi:hypothetical protein
MSLIFDIVHLTVAALLAIIGVGYEREEECPPVRFQPAAEVQTIDAAAPAASGELEVIYASECESSHGSVRFPAL